MKLVSILLVLVSGLIVSGCGDDDEEEPAAPTKAAFIAEADRICAEADRSLSAEAREQYPEGPPLGEDAVRFAEDVLIPNLEGQHEAIATLTPPEDAEDAVSDILEKLQAGIDELKGEPKGFVESEALVPASAAADDFGLTECGI